MRLKKGKGIMSQTKRLSNVAREQEPERKSQQEMGNSSLSDLESSRTRSVRLVWCGSWKREVQFVMHVMRRVAFKSLQSVFCNYVVQVREPLPLRASLRPWHVLSG